jgi:hypothetical protein
MLVRISNPVSRLLTAALVLVTLAGSPAVSTLHAFATCDGCPRHVEPVLVEAVPENQERSCCDSDEPADSGLSASYEDEPAPEESKGCCPSRCGHCCVVHARVPAMEAGRVTIQPPVGIGFGSTLPPTLPPPAGVDRSVFHPPRA